MLHHASSLQNYFTRVMAENGYKTITTYFQDFTIAEFFGVKVIRNTYRKAFNEHKEDVHYMTEIAMVLNHNNMYHIHAIVHHKLPLNLSSSQSVEISCGLVPLLFQSYNAHLLYVH